MKCCYFCKNELIPFIDKENSGNYLKHYCCYYCPKVPTRIDLDIWRQPYCIIVNENKIDVSYIYFHNLQLWMHIFHFERPFIDIKNNSNNCIFRLNYDINEFHYSHEYLENKIKTWIVFS